MVASQTQAYSVPQVDPLQSAHPVIVYLDFKSPYAYLAVEPTRRLEAELGVEFDWRPFVLDIPSYLGSAKLDAQGRVIEQERTPAQWAAVKYAYYDCRRYANVAGLTIRGTTKIWDTNLLATALWWIKKTKASAIPKFIDAIYQPFWKRELDAHSITALNDILTSLDLDHGAFIEWAEREGSEFNKDFQSRAFELGVYGVPTYVVNNELFFGREHLPRIGWLLGEQKEITPDIANLLPEDAILPPTDSVQIHIGIDNSWDALLAIPRLVSSLKKHHMTANWYRISSQELDDLLPHDPSNVRGSVHREYRARNAELNKRRYVGHDRNSDDLPELINQTIEDANINLLNNPPEVLASSPMPGISISIGDQHMIGRQHLPLINALLDKI